MQSQLIAGMITVIMALSELITAMTDDSMATLDIITYKRVLKEELYWNKMECSGKLSDIMYRSRSLCHETFPIISSTFAIPKPL